LNKLVHIIIASKFYLKDIVNDGYQAKNLKYGTID